MATSSARPPGRHGPPPACNQGGKHKLLSQITPMLCGSQPPNPLTDNRLREDIVKELDRRARSDTDQHGRRIRPPRGRTYGNCKCACSTKPLPPWITDEFTWHQPFLHGTP